MKIVSKWYAMLTKRNVIAPAFYIGLLTLMLGVYNSVNVPSTKEIKRVLLELVTFQKDPKVVYHRDEILNDYQERISDEFAIPEGLRDRVGFWFDVYTRYDSNNRIIHHSRYPWIIFKVVDVTDIVNADMPRVRWLRNVKADKFVAKEAQAIRDSLKAIAKKSSLDELSAEEKALVDLLEPLPGSIKKKALRALEDLRVQTGQRNFFAEGLEIAPQYMPGMEDVFRKNKLPVELTRIPFVESSFNKHATSKVGASGIWQFMEGTGKKFLLINEHIDERHSPFKSSEAAAALLKENHMILHRSWPLAVTAWNHGPPGVRRAIKAAGTKDLADIVSSYSSKTFDFASANFYAEFLAALHAEKYHEEIFTDVEYKSFLEVRSVRVERKLKAKDLVRKSGLSVDDFLLYNPDLKKALEKNAYIPSGYELIVKDTDTVGMVQATF